MTSVQCPKCNGTGRVLSHLNPYDANKVGAGMGMHRCDRCAGQGVIHGASGAGGSQRLGEGLMSMIMALFVHPKFSFVGFWLISTGLLLSMAPLFNLEELPNWYTLTAMGISVVLAFLLRKIIPKAMKWIFFVAIGGLVLAFVGGMISAIIERSTSS